MRSWVVNVNTGEVHELERRKPLNANCQIKEIGKDHLRRITDADTVRWFLETERLDACAYCQPLQFKSKK